MELTWHGHSTWYVRQDGTSLLIDPFFDNPKTSLDPDSVEEPDFVLLTHGHADHIADAKHFSDAVVVSTPELVGYVSEEFGFDEGIGMNIGGTVACGDVYVTMHRADHTNGIMTQYEFSAGMPAGFLISGERPGKADGSTGPSFYHSGDTGLMVEMRDVLGEFLQPDAAAVPIGDHFTMGPEQAAIAVDWLGVDHAFPMHYDTFPPIEQDPSDFEQAITDRSTDVNVHVLEADEPFDLLS